MSAKKSLPEVFEGLTYLPDRTPEMAFSGSSSDAFAELSNYRDGAIYVGHYSGDSEWERHANGDEIVMAVAGTTTLVMRVDGRDERVDLSASEVCVVPGNVWHRFENSVDLKVMTVTPQPTDHSLDDPGDE